MKAAAGFFYISNSGQEIFLTSYWSTDHARTGHMYWSWNAGALRVLLPVSSMRYLEMLPPLGTPCAYLQYGVPEFPGCPTLLWEDDPLRPFYVVVSRSQVNRVLPASDHGKEATLIWYGPDPSGGAEAVRELRRETVRVLVCRGH